MFFLSIRSVITFSLCEPYFQAHQTILLIAHKKLQKNKKKNNWRKFEVVVVFRHEIKDYILSSNPFFLYFQQI